MYTILQLQMLRSAVGTSAQIPGVDYQVGNLLPTSSLVSVKTLTGGPGWTYDPKTDLVRISGDNVTISGIDFGSAEVMIGGNNVTLKNCTFEPDPASLNWYCVYQYGSGGTIENCTITGQPVPMRQGAIATSNPITIKNNIILNSPGDAIDVQGGATVTGNYISGGGYSAAHSDGVWVTNTNGVPTKISNNFIDLATQDTGPNTGNTIRITEELGSVSNVTVTGNYLLGGSYSVAAGAGNNVKINGNYIGFSLYGNFYPSIAPGADVSGNTTFDWRNADYSTNAWNAYSSSLGASANIVTSTGGNVQNTSTQYETLYGAGYHAHIAGGNAGTNLVGGFGGQSIDLGYGANIVTELSISDSSTMSGIDAVSNFDPMKDVIDLHALDADPFTSGQQSFTYIGTAAFSGTAAQVRYYQDPTTKKTVVQAKLAGETSADLTINLYGLVSLSASNFALTSTSSAAAVAAAQALKVTKSWSGATPVTYETNYTGVIGKPYADYQTFVLSGKLAAKNIDYGTASSITSNTLEIAQTGVTLTRAASNDTLKIGTGTFTLPLRPSETTTIDAGASATINLQQGFKSETISGFDLNPLTSPDTLNLSRGMFSYVTSSMTDSQALAAVISHATAVSGGLMISDSYGDKLTLNGATTTTLAAATNVHMV